jgi:hypothetical protein
MLQNWGFLIAEIWALVLVAGAMGLAVGWLVWGRKGKP